MRGRAAQKFRATVHVVRVVLFDFCYSCCRCCRRSKRERENERTKVSAKVGETRSSTSDRHSSKIEDKEERRRVNTKNARSPGEHPLPTISKNASSLSSAKYAFAHSNHTRNGANSDWRTPRMSSTFVWERLCGSIETCSPLSPIGTWIKEGALMTSSRPCCCVMTMFPSLNRSFESVCNESENDEIQTRQKPRQKFRVLNPNT